MIASSVLKFSHEIAANSPINMLDKLESNKNLDIY
jgi:hypothetical protein